jgi:Family of unknown function (DUF6593)
VVLIPDEYRQHLMGCVDSTGVQFKGFKPAIYLIDPDNKRNALWVPAEDEPAEQPASTSDDETHSECIALVDSLDGETLHDEPLSRESSSNSLAEMSIYRTGWQNRIVRANTDNNTPAGLYYAEIPWKASGTHLTVRRGDRTGPVIAEVTRPGPRHSLSIVIQSGPDPLNLRLGCPSSRLHTFCYRNRNLAWTQPSSWEKKLMDLDSGEVLAEFHAQAWSMYKDGELLVREGEEKELVDLIVVTALSCQQREREVRRSGNGLTADSEVSCPLCDEEATELKLL